MDKTQKLDTPHARTQDVVIDEESAFELQIAALQRQIAALREDNEDLRASALWWKALYDEAQRRCADFEGLPRARATARVDPRFPMTSSRAAHAPRSTAIRRPL